MTGVVRTDGPATLPTDDEIARTYRVARGLAMSGLFEDTQSAEQAFGKILLGQDLGLSPTQALTAIHLVEGKPELSANLQAAMVRQYRSPEGDRYDYRVTRLDDDRCEVAFFRMPGDGRDPYELGRSSFSMEDAAKAGLAARRGPWQSYPRNMMFARALSNGVAWHVPEVTFGMRVYGPGEVGGPEVAPELPPHGDDLPVPGAEVVADAEPLALDAGDDEPPLGDDVSADDAQAQADADAAWAADEPDSGVPA